MSPPPISPAQQADAIKIPVLLIHGDVDQIVPLSQSELMKKALDAAGNTTELLVLEKSGHSGWTAENDKRALRAIDRFLSKHLSPDAREAE
ncbi:MAG TPA: prolyl oligopeptidase family serine peptidase [Steroidobacteraceae bacterium]|nr:prolyl oligopeptidase family serine peptidase [Steroidobacteraceae bacterium]